MSIHTLHGFKCLPLKRRVRNHGLNLIPRLASSRSAPQSTSPPFLTPYSTHPNSPPPTRPFPSPSLAVGSVPQAPRAQAYPQGPPTQRRSPREPRASHRGSRAGARHLWCPRAERRGRTAAGSAELRSWTLRLRGCWAEGAQRGGGGGATGKA